MIEFLEKLLVKFLKENLKNALETFLTEFFQRSRVSKETAAGIFEKKNLGRF